MKTSLKIRTACASLLLGSAAVMGLGSWQESYALPPGGAATVDTPGTSSTVSPQTLKAGDTLSFTVSGFPAGQQLYVKVDDGDACPSDSAQGACVVHQQKISSNGTVSGSFVLSKQLEEGPHTLRFLATQVKTDSKGNNIGSIGFSNRSPQFIISGVNENSSGGTVVNVDPDVINSIEQDAAANNGGNEGDSGSQDQGNSGSQNQNNSGSQSGGSDSQGGSNDSGTTSGGASQSQDSSGQTIYLDADGNQITKEEYDALMAEADQTGEEETQAEAAASASAGASASASASSKASASAQATKAGQSVEASASKGSSVPWIGIIALAVAVVIAAVVIILRRRSAS